MVAAKWEGRTVSPDRTGCPRAYWPMTKKSQKLAPLEEGPEHLNLPAEAWWSRPAPADTHRTRDRALRVGLEGSCSEACSDSSIPSYSKNSTADLLFHDDDPS